MSGFAGDQNDAAIILCLSGRATIKINLTDYEVDAGCEVVLLPDCICTIMAKSEDFGIVQYTMEESMFSAVSRNMDPDFFGRLKDVPVYRHNERTLPASTLTLSLLKEFSMDTGNRYRQECEALLVRSLLLRIADFIEKNGDSTPGQKKTRPAQWCERFIRLVIHNCSRERKVQWYASRLCISSRHLSEVISEIIGQSPKQIIDNYAIQEISVLLTHSDLSIQQIADKMHFSDQSTLGRYFKQHTGISPAAYRTANPSEIAGTA